MIADQCQNNYSYNNLAVRIFIFLAFFSYFPSIYLSPNIIALGEITKEAGPSANWHLYDSWRSSDMFFQHRLLNKQSIPPGHRRKSNMITKSGHIEKPKVFLTKIRRNFLLETQAKITKECIEEGIFDIANISYKSDEKTEKVVCFKGQIKLWIGHRMGSWLLNWQWGEEVRDF